MIAHESDHAPALCGCRCVQEAANWTTHQNAGPWHDHVAGEH